MYYDLSYSECIQDTKNVYRSEYGTLKSDEEVPNLLAYDIPTYIGMESIFIDINYFDESELYHKIYEPFQVDIYDSTYSMTEPKSVIFIDPNNPSSFYIPFTSEGLKQNLRYDIHLGEGKHFSNNKFAFNSSIPFDINILRSLCIFFACLLLYSMWLKLQNVKKN